MDPHIVKSAEDDQIGFYCDYQEESVEFETGLTWQFCPFCGVRLVVAPGAEMEAVSLLERQVREFCEKLGLTLNEQVHKLSEETGEVSEAYLGVTGNLRFKSDIGMDEFEKELGQVGHTLYTIAYLAEVDLDATITRVAKENLGREPAGYEVVAIDRGPDVIDDGDTCGRCGTERVAGESSWIVEYNNDMVRDACSQCVAELEVGAVDTEA